MPGGGSPSILNDGCAGKPRYIDVLFGAARTTVRMSNPGALLAPFRASETASGPPTLSVVSELIGLEIGSWAEVLGAIGALAAAVLSIAAIRAAQAANKTAEGAREEALRTAGATQEREERSQLAEVARQLQAWWVVWSAGGETHYGVLVTNAGQGATVFQDVRIETRGNFNARGPAGAITLTSLPPGTFVFESMASGSGKAWGDADFADAQTQYRPLLKAQSHAVECITFRDPLNRRWRWTPAAGLEQVEAA